MNKKYITKSLKGLINPVKIAPIGTGLTLVGLILGIDSINPDLGTENAVMRAFESTFSVNFFFTGIYSLCESYRTYFRELKKILKSGINKGRLRWYDRYGPFCSQLGCKAAAKELGYYDLYKSTINEIKQENNCSSLNYDNKN